MEQKRRVTDMHEENTARLSELTLMMKEQNKNIDDIKVTGAKTLTQAEKTNGRVSKLENWQNFITGGLSVLTMLVVPILLYLVIHSLK